MQRICVFCGSANGADPKYIGLAKNLGRLMAKEGIDLVYGGGKVGLMGAVADSVLEHGGEVTGVIPDFLARKEIRHDGVTHLEVVDTMHTRKTKMAELSDGFITLPGGYGTLEELCEIITWAQLGLHQNPVCLINIDGYYDLLVQQLDHMVEQGFLRPDNRSMLLVANYPEEALQMMREYQAPKVKVYLEDSEDT